MIVPLIRSHEVRCYMHSSCLIIVTSYEFIATHQIADGFTSAHMDPSDFIISHMASSDRTWIRPTSHESIRSHHTSHGFTIVHHGPHAFLSSYRISNEFIRSVQISYAIIRPHHTISRMHTPCLIIHYSSHGWTVSHMDTPDRLASHID